MTYGLMIVINLKELSASKRRLFRKKRLKLMKKTNLKRIKNGVYLVPFENYVPSKNEVGDITQIEDLIRESHVKANYFMVTQVEIEHWVSTSPAEVDSSDADMHSILDALSPKHYKSYFVLKPIKIEEE